MSERKLVAGVDTSTQSCKIVIRDVETGELVNSGTAKHPDGTECHPDEWWTAFNEAKDCFDGFEEVSAISVGGQQHGMVLLDADGEIIRPALLWNDVRSAKAAEDLISELGAKIAIEEKSREESGEKAWADAIGSVLVASITITKIRWVAENEPENAKRIAAVCLPHDWLSWRIAGYGPKSSGLNSDLSSLFTDRSDASGTGYFDCVKNEYRRDLLALALAPLGDAAAALAENIILPKVLAPNEGITVASDDAVVRRGTLIGPGGGDNAAAALGLNLKPGEVSISLGTSGVVAAVSPTAAHDSSGAINGFADCTGNFLPLACTLNASRIIDAGRAILNVSYDEIGSLALESTPGADGITLVPYFEGERVPNRPAANATLFGLTLANSTRENIARAFVEGMLASQGDGLRLMRECGVPTDKIYMIGGSMKSPAVRSLAPAILQTDITLPELGEYVADGAARQAAWVLLGTPEPPEWKLNSEEIISASATPIVAKQYEKVSVLPTAGEL